MTNDWRYQHLLVLPVPFRQLDTALAVEGQAVNGLARWLDSFDNLAVAAPVIPENIAAVTPEMRWKPLPEAIGERAHLVPLPWAYRPDQFIWHLPRTIPVLSELIRTSRYLQFAIGGFWGDWASVAAELAIKQKRPFAVHTDNVAHEFVRSVSEGKALARLLRTRFDSALIHSWHRRIVRHAHLGLPSSTLFRVSG